MFFFVVSVMVAELPSYLPDVEFVSIPGGEIVMEQTVAVEDFQIMSREVSQEFWEAVMGYNPSLFRGEDLPVENVSRVNCVELADRLNELDSQYVYMLPTPDQWEYACRGGSPMPTCFFWGDCCDDSLLQRFCVCAQTSWGHTHPVDSGCPNGFGVLNMAGNVMEWCSTTESGEAVARGGCWEMNPEHCISSAEYHLSEDFSGSVLGLRLVRVPAENGEFIAGNR